VSRGRFPLCLLVNPRFNPCFSGQHATFFMAQLIRCCDENIHLTHLCWANIGLSLQDNKKKSWGGTPYWWWHSTTNHGFTQLSG
jgi:hypothetical protein